MTPGEGAGAPDPGDLYVDLLKRTLSFSLWPEPPVPLEAMNAARPFGVRHLVAAAAWGAGLLGIQLARRRRPSEEERREGRIWPRCADTMIGLKRLDNLHHCVETVLREGVPGDLIETGVWRGGSCILMRGILAARGDRTRRVFVADSFAGLPPPDAATWPADRGDRHFAIPGLAIPREEVEGNFRRYGLLDDRVVFLEGWFKDTLPRAPVERLAVLRLDGDMYGSTMDALVNLYPKLSPGGFCIVDDHALEGCRAAVADYRREHAVTEEILPIDWTGAYWRKR